jgi:GrpB-like predicted nucleotidyltransferase (UPF0157 family)
MDSGEPSRADVLPLLRSGKQLKTLEWATITDVSPRGRVVVTYRRDWLERAADLISSLDQHLAGLVDRIEHIGSTSIPGMAAKDVLDLQVSVRSLEVADDAFREPLGALGFQPSVYRQDHVPAGRADDPDEWTKRLWTRRAHLEGDVNLHVRRTGSPNERLALLFRDWFRAHPGAVPAYANFKIALAHATPDIDVYTDVKDPVVDLVIVIAETWAVSVDWHP